MACQDCNDTSIPIGPTGPAGNGSLIIKDEGVTKTTVTESINFTGTGVTATNSGNNVTVNIPGLTSSTGIVLYNSTSNTAATDSAAYIMLAEYELPLNTMTGNGDYLEIYISLAPRFAGSNQYSNDVSAIFLVAGITANIKVPNIDMIPSATDRNHVLKIKATRTSASNLFLDFEYVPTKSSVSWFEPVTAFDAAANQMLEVRGRNNGDGSGGLGENTIECSHMIVTYFKKP